MGGGGIGRGELIRERSGGVLGQCPPTLTSVENEGVLDPANSNSEVWIKIPGGLMGLTEILVEVVMFGGDH